MVVEVGPEIEQLVLEVCSRPKQRVVEILASNGADEPFHEPSVPTSLRQV